MESRDSGTQFRLDQCSGLYVSIGDFLLGSLSRVGGGSYINTTICMYESFGQNDFIVL